MYKNLSSSLIQSQYLYTNIASLMLKRAEVWDNYIGNIAKDFNDKILNLNTCSFEVLVKYWGTLLKISPFFEKDGKKINLTQKEFSDLIKIRLFNTTWQGDAKQINLFFNNLYTQRGKVFIDDKANTFGINYTFNFKLTSNEKFIFLNKDILPRPLGVKLFLIEIDDKNQFGFKNSHFQPFGQGVFFAGNL